MSFQSTLALSLGNRSACLFQMGDYELAISDINFALSLGYPEQIRYKLYDRLGRCHLKGGNPAKAKPSFLIAQKLVSNCAADMEEKKINELKNSFQDCIQECEKISNVSNKPDQTKETISLPDAMINTTDMTRSNDYPALGFKVEVKQDDIVGRYIMAKESLKVGETVLVESPFASVLYPEQNGKNCHHCFK